MDDSESCKTLEEAIYDLYARIDVDADMPYQFFTLKDLIYSGILMGRDDLGVDPRPLSDFTGSTRQLGDGQSRCDLLADNYKFTTRDTDNCTWSYECAQRQAQFPSFYLEAKLDSTSSTNSCTPVQQVKNRRFVRTTCQYDNTIPHWLECDCSRAVVGYRHAAS